MAREYVTERRVRTYAARELAETLGMEIPEGAQLVLESNPGALLVTVGYIQKVEASV